MTDTVRLPIEGMTCTSCVAHITKAVRRVSGVESIRVDLGSDSATVTFDAGATSLDAIARAIRDTGYEPRVEQAEPAAMPSRRVGRFGWLIRRHEGGHG